MTSQPTRAYDALYDKDYTVSGSRDFYRDQARAGGFTLERVPQYGNLFSEIPTYPSQTVRFRNIDKVPKSVNREFLGNAGLTHGEMTNKSNADRVSGNNRYMFFRRPLYAPSNQMLDQPPPNVVLEPTDPLPDNEIEEAPVVSRTFGTQSDFREMETQTIPYQPDYVIPKDMSLKQSKLDEKYHLGGLPEVLTLKDFKYGDDKLKLPVGLYEVQKIEKMREKRAFEASLPPLSDQSKIHIRKRMLDEWESKEWKYRENEIKEIQNEHLVKMETALIKRERKFEAETRKRIEKLERQKVSDNQALLADIQKRRIKTMRKLEKRRQLSAFKPEKPTRAEEYANYGSKVYAPLTRDGKSVESGDTTIDPVPYQPREITNFMSMQQELDTEVIQPETYKSREAENVPKESGQKAAKVVTKQLEHVMDLLEHSKTSNGRRGIGSCWPEPLAANQQNKSAAEAKKKKKVQLEKEDKDAVVVEIPDPEKIAQENAVILLQRLLRGRAVQNEMYQGKEKRLELIEELQTTKEHDLEIVASTAEEASMDAVLGIHFAEILEILAIQDSKQQTVMLYDGQDKWAQLDRENGLFDTPPSTSGSMTAQSSRANTASRGASRGTSRGSTMRGVSRGSAGFGPLDSDGEYDIVEGDELDPAAAPDYIDILVDTIVQDLSAASIGKEEEEVGVVEVKAEAEAGEQEEEEAINVALEITLQEDESLTLTLDC